MEAKVEMKKQQGVYFLANDRCMDLAIAFLNSFRTYNPEIPLCLIPYDTDVHDLCGLSATYKFSIFDDLVTLGDCDTASLAFFSTPRGQFRKLAAWEGKFDEFVYIDIDTVVLHSVEFCFEYLKRFGFVTSHSDIPGIRKWVWKDSIYSADSGLSMAQISFSANTGFIASRRGLLSRNLVSQKVSQASTLAEHMELFCVEQPLLNYLIVTAGVPYSSLLTIARTTGSHEIPLERWAGRPIGRIVDGKVIVENGSPPILLVHWAGEWQSGRHQTNPLWRYYRDLGVRQG